MPVDIDKAGDTVDKASGFFDKLNAFIKRHPIWFIVIIIGGLVYWVSTLPDESMEDEVHQVEEVASEIPQSASQHKEEYKITKQTYFVDTYGKRKGDTVYVDYYDDGFIDKYYMSDGKTYYADE
jgi:hypothetical protein